MTDREVFRNAEATDSEVSGKLQLVAPYNFIPLEAPLLSCFGDAVPSHARPLPDGVCGALTVDWLFEQPVLVGGGKEDHATTFTTDADSKPAIPGSTIRGLLRNVIEIASGSRVDIVDRDAHFAVRDSRAEYWRAHSPLARDGSRAMSFGWLVRRNPKAAFGERTYDGWSLKVVEKAWQIETAHLLRSVNCTTEVSVFETMSVKAKYDELAAHGDARIKFSTTEKEGARSFEESRKAVVDARAGNLGWIVFTGVDPNRGGVKRKRYATVFESTDDVDAGHPLPADLVRRFIRVHSTASGGERAEGPRGAWDFWFAAYRDRCADKRDERGPWPRASDGTPIPGIPVFIVHKVPTKPRRGRGGETESQFDARNEHGRRAIELRKVLRSLQSQVGRKGRRGESVKPEDLFLNLSRFVKVPHRYGTEDLLASDGHGESGPLDFARALFGQVPSEKKEEAAESEGGVALKGRVFFGAAALDHKPERNQYREEIGTTMTPRASFWPYYLRPDEEPGPTKYEQFDYSNEKSRLAGWKRYPVRSNSAPLAPFPWDDRQTHLGERQKKTGYVAPTEAAMRFLMASEAKPLRFTGTTRFHNLKPAELGALLWAITWGAFDGRGISPVPQRHLIGRGKAQGYGRCRAEMRKLKIEPNMGDQALDPAEYVRSFREHVTQQYALKHPDAKVTGFEGLPMVKQLLAMADPVVAAGLEARLTYPRHPFAPQIERAKALAGGKIVQGGLDDEKTPSLVGYTGIRAAAIEAAENGKPPVRLPPYPTEV